jgi:hypothetical protein
LVGLSRPCIVIGGNFPLQIDCISARERMRVTVKEVTEADSAERQNCKIPKRT